MICCEFAGALWLHLIITFTVLWKMYPYSKYFFLICLKMCVGIEMCIRLHVWQISLQTVSLWVMFHSNQVLAQSTNSYWNLTILTWKSVKSTNNNNGLQTVVPKRDEMPFCKFFICDSCWSNSSLCKNVILFWLCKNVMSRKKKSFWNLLYTTLIVTDSENYYKLQPQHPSTLNVYKKIRNTTKDALILGKMLCRLKY